MANNLLIQLRLREVCSCLGDTAGYEAAVRRIASLREDHGGAAAELPPPADITIVDPIFRGSRLYYSAMLCEAVSATAPEASINILTRRDTDSDLFPNYRERLSVAKLQPHLAVPKELWYGRVPEEACRQIVQAMVDARPGSIFAFAGLTELLPTLGEQMEIDGRQCPVHVVGYEYAMGTLADPNKQNALQKIRSKVLSLGCWLLDESFDRAQFNLPNIDLTALPDPIPHRDDDELLKTARKERSSFVDTSRKDGTLALLAVGLQSSRKGLRDLIRAARIIEKRELPVRIYVSGKLADGEHELARQVSRLTRVMRSRAEYVDDAEILRTYNACDAVLLPYALDFSGSSGVFAHAVAFSKPIIATEHGCVGWRTKEFQLGLTYPAGDADSLVAKIEQMISWSEDEWQAARKKSAEYYSRTNYSQTLQALGKEFQRLGLGSHHPAPESRIIVDPSLKRFTRRSARTSLNPDDFSFALDAADSIRQICLLDTGIGSRNMGDHIIVDSIRGHLRRAFPQAIFVTVPTHEYMGTESLKLVDSSDIRLVCGTNLLASHMDEYKQWKIGGLEFAALRDITLMGCGWWQYQEAPNSYSELLLGRILSDKTTHSVRDSYTAAKLSALGGKKVINTTCPTLWALTPEHVAQISERQARDVVTTLTDYKADADVDGFMLDHLAARYRHVYVWIQGTGDFKYLKQLCAKKPSESIRVVPATLEAYDALLESDLDLDYVGTRLHAGVRALQRKRRSLILAVDNRAREISADTGLPCIPREQAREKLEDLIPSYSPRSIRLPTDAIRSWLAQFV